MPCRCSSMSPGGVAAGWWKPTSRAVSSRFRTAGLMQAVEERVCDQAVLALIRTLLRAGVMEGGSLRRGVAGTPQGGVISPLLCNAYLHRLDRAWRASEHGVLVRYADDVVVMCDTREQAEAALAQLTDLLAGLGLEPKAAKTRIVHLAEGNPGFDFLGFHHRLVRGRTPKSAHLTFLARWPSRKAAQHARDRIREITGRERLLVPAEVIVDGTELVPARLGRVLPLRELGSCPRPGRELRPLAAGAVVVQEGQPAARLAVGRDPGAAITGSPGPGQPPSNRHPAQALPGLAREGRTPPVKNVGKPCAGEPHARFDGRGLETGRQQRNRASPRPSPFRRLDDLAPVDVILSWMRGHERSRLTIMCL